MPPQPDHHPQIFTQYLFVLAKIFWFHLCVCGLWSKFNLIFFSFPAIPEVFSTRMTVYRAARHKVSVISVFWCSVHFLPQTLDSFFRKRLCSFDFQSVYCDLKSPINHDLSSSYLVFPVLHGQIYEIRDCRPTKALYGGCLYLGRLFLFLCKEVADSHGRVNYASHGLHRGRKGLVML